MSVAQRVAEEMDVKLGIEVGYTIRSVKHCDCYLIIKALYGGTNSLS